MACKTERQQHKINQMFLFKFGEVDVAHIEMSRDVDEIVWCKYNMPVPFMTRDLALFSMYHYDRSLLTDPIRKEQMFQFSWTSQPGINPRIIKLSGDQ